MLQVYGLPLFAFFSLLATAIAPFGEGQIGNAAGDEGQENEGGDGEGGKEGISHGWATTENEQGIGMLLGIMPLTWGSREANWGQGGMINLTVGL